MKSIAVISDVHANMEALDAVLAEAEGMDVVCLGDLVDYGAEPNESIAALRDRGVRSIVGNHDVIALTGDVSMLNPKAAMSSIWTRARLSRASRAYLEGLPEEIRMRVEGVDLYFTHGSPEDHLWEYVDPAREADLFGFFLDRVKAQCVGLGHTHVPYVWQEAGRVVFNPGSVGQPRDGDSRAAYAVVDVDGGRVGVRLRRVPYDFGKAASKIREAGLPASHADRLATGT
ncbi:MAG: metallophosphoesterase family protein [Nitrososphaerota archaeon]|nr:metallophosphoesterase family protein [Nitrososphaerota archaeon]MDG6975187.1 metallophosphoesterase family protein [Nitrososphaerota archaeon]MDG7010079.1 metallophosphoesterase family protein [Nitrososphaerota archaeon]MDG7016156.1 metallophosphoesterase family protein [Nitrososphaerota archaeon]MDG7019483.1 metallophosphoesterase family protein [Nitrososphaerota archaeon]